MGEKTRGKEREKKREKEREREMRVVDLILQEIGYTHMRLTEGVDSQLQLSGLLARLCLKSINP